MRLLRASAGVLIIMSGALLSARVAHAEPIDNGSTTVQVNPAATYPVVTQGAAGFGQAGISASAQASGNQGSAGGGHGGYYYRPTYTYTPVPNGQTIYPGPLQITPTGYIVKPQGTGVPACPPGQIGYYVYDGNGNYLGIVCVNPPSGSTPGGPPSPPVILAQQVSDTQAWPALVMNMNPGRGLTGLPSWFWLGGGSPTIPDATATAGPLTVRVHAAFAGVTWAFGDGSQLDTVDLGQPYPQASDVNHEYQADSSGQPNGMYEVVALIRFKVTYSLNGGPWVDLGVKVRGYGSSFVVNQLQPEATQ
jgi:hypothetical protein